MAAFGDLNICETTENGDTRETERLISKAAKLGFQTIAINKVFTLKKSGRKEENTPVPWPRKWDEVQAIRRFKKEYPKLRILSRLTVPLDEQSQVHQLASDRVQAYDILAVEPRTEKHFLQAVTTLEADIISLDFKNRLPFYLRHPQVNKAIERGIVFEIVYSPAIRDTSQRRYTISNALDLVRVSRGRNIIISSEAVDEMDLRGPYDISNLGLLFGLKEDQSKAAVSKHVRAVLFHADARKGTGKSAISGQPVHSLQPGEQWKIEGSETREQEEGESEDDEVETERKRPRTS